MILKHKTIFVGLFCLALFLGFGGVAAAQAPAEEPAVPALVLSDMDKDIMNFICGTNAEDWDDGMFDNSSVEYEPELGGLIVAGEVPIYVVKSKISGNLDVCQTKIKESKEALDAAVFIPRIISGDITQVKEITYWRHRETGLLVATNIVIR